HAGHHAGREGAPAREPGADGARGARSVVGQSLSLHRLHQDGRGRTGRGGRSDVSVRRHPFGLVEPESLSEAVDAVTRLDGEARLVAGGTALVPMIRLGLVKPDRLVSLHRVPGLAEIRMDGPALELGAMATHADIERSRVVRDGWPLLGEAVRRVATPAIRTSGTIGGNLAYAEPASDPAPALLCHDAEVHLAGPAGIERCRLRASSEAFTRRRWSPARSSRRSESHRRRRVRAAATSRSPRARRRTNRWSASPH